MQLTTKVRYAVVFLLHLANETDQEKFIGASEVSDKQRISASYLEQLARKLRKAGVVEPRKGPTGGYKLAREPKDISLVDVFEAVGENYAFNLYDLCMHETVEVDAYNSYMLRISGILRQELKKITLENIRKKNYENC